MGYARKNVAGMELCIAPWIKARTAIYSDTLRDYVPLFQE